MADVGVGADVTGFISDAAFSLPNLHPRAVVSGWALLDPCVATGGDPNDVGTTGMASNTSSGGYFRVSISYRPPPAISHVHMYTEENLWGIPAVVAADGDLILVYAAVVDDDLPTSCYPENYFVYKPHPLRPSLHRLPDLPTWTGQVLDTGIAYRGDEYVVAAFSASRAVSRSPDGQLTRKEVGNILRYSSTTQEWETMELSIPYDPEKGLHKFIWQTDKVFHYSGYMCWVDYHRGILFADVFTSFPQLLFVRLPGIEIWDVSHDYDRGNPAGYRFVDVSKGLVKFVDLDNGLFGRIKTSGFTITTWTLKLPDLEWEEDCVFSIDHLWRLPKFEESSLPRWAPAYPVVSKQEPHVIHLILIAPNFEKFWVITLDMKDVERSSYVPYSNPRKDLRKYQLLEDDVDFTNNFPVSPFIRCELNYLNLTTG